MESIRQRPTSNCKPGKCRIGLYFGKVASVGIWFFKPPRKLTLARIAFLIPNLAGGGAERVALTLVTAFAERGHEVDLLVMERRGELVDLVPPTVRLIDLKTPRVRNVLGPLVCYLRERRPDAIQVSMWPLTIMGIIARGLSRVPVRCAVSDHAILTDHYPVSKHLAIGTSMRLFYRFADARIAVSSGAADDLAHLSGMRRQSFDVLANPIAFPETLSRRPDIEALWGNGSKRILTVGHLKPEKNQALLIRAFALLPRALYTKLMIAGDGDLRGELMALAERERVADRVIFAGFVPDPWPLYASADLFALSSREESFGNVLVEALYAGLPIVSTANTGSTEVLEQGRYGRIVKRGDLEDFARALEVALSAKVDREELRSRALALSGESSITAYEQLLLGSRGEHVGAVQHL